MHKSCTWMIWSLISALLSSSVRLHSTANPGSVAKRNVYSKVAVPFWRAVTLPFFSTRWQSQNSSTVQKEDAGGGDI